MSRVSHTGPHSFATQLKQLLKDIRNLKRRQTIGPQSLVLYRTENNTYASSGISVGAYQQKKLTVIFAPGTKKNIYAKLGYFHIVAGASGFETIEQYPDPDNQDLPDGKTAWKVIFNADANAVTLRIGFILKSTDEGVISVTVS